MATEKNMTSKQAVICIRLFRLKGGLRQLCIWMYLDEYFPLDLTAVLCT